MGRDKSRIVFRGETLAERAVRTLGNVCSKVSTVGGVEIPGIPSVKDIDHSDGGNRCAAIFGVHSALAHSRTEWTAILACDLPFVTPELWFLMFSKATEASDAIAPVQTDGRRQPLCALYRTKPSLILANKRIESGELSMQNLLDHIDAKSIDFAEIAQVRNAEDLFINVNTAEDLELALTIPRSSRRKQIGGDD